MGPKELEFGIYSQVFNLKWLKRFGGMGWCEVAHSRTAEKYALKESSIWERVCSCSLEKRNCALLTLILFLWWNEFNSSFFGEEERNIPLYQNSTCTNVSLTICSKKDHFPCQARNWPTMRSLSLFCNVLSMVGIILLLQPTDLDDFKRPLIKPVSMQNSKSSSKKSTLNSHKVKLRENKAEEPVVEDESMSVELFN